jgi:hypothetical protein
MRKLRDHKSTCVTAKMIKSNTHKVDTLYKEDKEGTWFNQQKIMEETIVSSLQILKF